MSCSIIFCAALVLVFTCSICSAQNADAAVQPPTLPPQTGSCGLSKYSGLTADRIVGGTNAQLHEVPWIVRLGITDSAQIDPTIAWCGGVVISENYVITLATCIYFLSGYNATSLTAYFSDYDRTTFSNPGEFSMVIPTSSATLHPSFNVSIFDYDFALLKLPLPLDFSTWNVQPVCLPDACPNDFGSACPVASQASVAGWGRTNDTNPESNTLLIAYVDIVGNGNCSVDFAGINPVTPEEICASGIGGVSVCYGDGGGPLTELNSQSAATLCGMPSWGNGCGAQYPGVFSRVCKVIDWINETISPNS